MLEEILKYERNAFFFLNGSDSPFLDHFMWLFSGKIVWIPLALIIICTLAYKKNWRETVFILLAIALTITLCDQFASHICKPISYELDTDEILYQWSKAISEHAEYTEIMPKPQHENEKTAAV